MLVLIGRNSSRMLRRDCVSSFCVKAQKNDVVRMIGIGIERWSSGATQPPPYIEGTTKACHTRNSTTKISDTSPATREHNGYGRSSTMMRNKERSNITPLFNSSNTYCYPKEKRYGIDRIRNGQSTLRSTSRTMPWIRPLLLLRTTIRSVVLRSYSTTNINDNKNDDDDDTILTTTIDTKDDDTTQMSISATEQELLDQNEFGGDTFLEAQYFRSLVSHGIFKKIDTNFCQDNRDHSKPINPKKKVILNQTLDIELVNKGYRAKVYYVGKNGAIVAEIARNRRKHREHQGELIGPLPNGYVLERVYRVLQQTKHKGYNYVMFSGIDSSRRSTELVSVIVLATFDKNRVQGMTVDHKNRIKDDNNISNLRWATSSEQVKNRVMPSTRKRNTTPFPYKTMQEAKDDGLLFYQHPSFEFIYISDSKPVNIWNDKRKRFLVISQTGERHNIQRRVWIRAKTCTAARLIWEAYNDQMLGGNDSIDHINGDRTDDTKANLRKVDHTGNAFNKKKRGNTKTSKPRQLAENGQPLCETIDTGISLHRLKSGAPAKHPWRARWQERGRSVFKSFKTKQECISYRSKMHALHHAPHLPNYDEQD